MTSEHGFTLRLFYSYSHKDGRYRDQMEESLALLRDNAGVLEDWSDRQILPGQRISQRLQDQIDKTDIFVFLLSNHFLASKECKKEWAQACGIGTKRPDVVLVPIILSPCAWKDMPGMSDFRALPEDGRPIKDFKNRELAWQQVYQGLKSLIDRLRQTFTLRDDFRKGIEKTAFLSQQHITLQELFVFPKLATHTTAPGVGSTPATIDNRTELLAHQYVLIHGVELSGKTAMCRYLFLSLVDDGKPVLYMNLADARQQPTSQIFSDEYRRQYHGDYSLWSQQPDKTIILDNLTAKTVAHVTLAVEHFERVIVILSTDVFYAYYKDDRRLARFTQIEIMPLTHGKQEELIRKRTATAGHGNALLDGQVDQIENRVNAVIISNRILPRYPFYVLSILQTYEGFMPSDLSITSYGHCYYVLILAHLMKAGISKTDDEINACVNFSENLAFKIYESGGTARPLGDEGVREFVNEYRKKYLINESTVNRMFDPEYGILSKDGRFRSPYMYYFFLGKYLARNGSKYKKLLERMCDESYIVANCLTLTFTIHHTHDSEIIDEILLRTMCALDDMEPSSLDRKEARVFDDIVAAIPREILSEKTVQAERETERTERDIRENDGLDEVGGNDDVDAARPVNDVYRIMKNGEILGQILRNKYGSMDRKKIFEIVETIADSRLRLVRLMVGSQDEMNELAAFIHERKPEIDLEKIKNLLRYFSFVWTMHNIETAVGALNKPEIRPVVEEVVAKRGTPAYELIGYFLRLDTMEEFSEKDRKYLKDLLNRHRYEFFGKVTSIRTQRYLMTHRVKAPVEQAVCSLLKIRYRPRLKKLV